MDVKQFVDDLVNVGYGPFIGVPCSNFKSMISYISQRYLDKYIIVNNEGEASAIATGLFLAGKKPVVFCQNSGIGNLYDPLTSLINIYNIKILLIVSWRGKNGINDEVQHIKMGNITVDLLRLADVHYQDLSEDKSLDLKRIDAHKGVYCLLIDRLTFERNNDSSSLGGFNKGVLSKQKVIKKVLEHISDKDFIFSSNGYISREVYAIAQRKRNFYMVGSMGCVSSIALGLSLGKSDPTVFVFEGDGALLMRLEVMVTNAKYFHGRLVHIMLDNGQYESTGGQTTLSTDVDFAMLARAVGYSSAKNISSMKKLEKILNTISGVKGSHFLRIEISEKDTLKPRIPSTVLFESLSKYASIENKDGF